MADSELKETWCPFCDMDSKRIMSSTENTLTFLDNFPVTEGHTLIIPKQHVSSLFDLPDAIQAELWSQIAKIRVMLQEKYKPDALLFNIFRYTNTPPCFNI